MTQAKRETCEPDPTAMPAAESPSVLLDDGTGASLPVPRRSPRLTTQAPAGSGLAPGAALSSWRMAAASALAVEKDRGLAFLFLPVAMGAGAGLFYMSPANPALLFLVAALLAALLVASFARRHHRGAALVAGYTAAICIGALAAALETSRGAILLDSDVTTTISGTVEAREFDAAGRVRYLIRLNATSGPEIRRPPSRVRLTARSPHDAIAVGAAISGRARLTAPSGPVMPGGYDFAFRAFVDGIGAHGYFFRAPEQTEQQPEQASAMARLFQAFSDGLRQIRERISKRIRTVLQGDPGAIAAALAVSDRRGISAPTVEALRATGLAHILAISGLHMALAAGTLYIGIRKGLALFPGLAEAWPVKKLAASGAMMTATAYLLISGGSVSTQRAWVMLTVMLVAVLADRAALTMRNVALAAIVIILVSPSAVVGPGFQMSFAATAALIAAYAALSGRARKARSAQSMTRTRSRLVRGLIFALKALLGLAITSLVAGLATGLFSAHHFHRLAGAGLLANLLAMPLVTLVVMPAGLVAMLLMPLGLDVWPLLVMGQGLESVVAVANGVHALGGDVNVGRMPLPATLAAGAGFVILVFLRSWLRLAGLVMIGLGLALATPPLAGQPPDILVSEKGNLVALAGPSGLASNAARPPSFVFGQWQTALRGAAHLPPVAVRAATPGQAAGPAPLPNAGILDRLISSAELQTSRFHCAGRGICAAVHSGVRIVAIDQAALIGAACDRTDLVVISIPVYLDACRSGATLVTARTLRRTGSLAITVKDGAAANGDPIPGEGNTSEDSIRRPDFQIEAALKGVIRPWTMQRYYDWRTGTFDLPD